MPAYILKRLLSLIPVLLTVAVVVFFVIHLTPGDPAKTILGQKASPEQVEQLREELGLNRPLAEQFITWTADLVRGDLGNSIFLTKAVCEVFLDDLGPTLCLAILAQIIGVAIAIPLGIIAARHRGTAIDLTIMGISLAGISIPSFLLGMLLILAFAVQIRWFPASGYQ